MFKPQLLWSCKTHILQSSLFILRHFCQLLRVRCQGSSSFDRVSHWTVLQMSGLETYQNAAHSCSSIAKASTGEGKNLHIWKLERLHLFSILKLWISSLQFAEASSCFQCKKVRNLTVITPVASDILEFEDEMESVCGRQDLGYCIHWYQWTVLIHIPCSFWNRTGKLQA